MQGFQHEKHRDNHRGRQRPQHRRWRLGRVVPFALLLTACTTTPEPRIEIREVKVPVAVPCPIDTTEPTYVADRQSLIEASKRGADAVVALLLGEIGQRKAWAEGVKKQAGGCRG